MGQIWGLGVFLHHIGLTVNSVNNTHLINFLYSIITTLIFLHHQSCLVSCKYLAWEEKDVFFFVFVVKFFFAKNLNALLIITIHIDSQINSLYMLPFSSFSVTQ